MEDQQRTGQLLPEKNGKYLQQPLLPVYTTAFQENNKAEDWDLRQFLTVLRRRVVVIGSVAIAVSVVLGFWTLTRQAKYEGKFQLLVEPVTKDEKSKLAELSQIPGTTVTEEDGLDYDSQIQVLQSPIQMAPIVEQLSTRYPSIDYNSLLKNLTLVRLKETKILEVRYKDSDPQKIQFVLQQLAKGYLKYSLQERQTNLRLGIQFVDSQMPQLRSRVNSLQRQLQQFRQHYNFIDPEVKAEQIAEQASIIKLQRLDTQRQLAEARSFYATLRSPSGTKLAETGALSATLSGSSAAKLAEIGGSKAVPGSGAKSADASSTGATLQDQSGATQTQSETSVYENLVNQLRDVESQIAANLTRYREDSPTIQALKQRRENLLPVLRQEAKRALGNKMVEVENQISALQVRAANIAQTENSLNQQVKQLPFLARQYTDLQRELKVATESLNRFLEKRESLQVEIAQKEVPWQVIAAPQLPRVPIYPRVTRDLILGAIAGVLAGLAAALLTERLDNVFHSADDLKEVTKLPLLGVIPFHKHLKPLASASEAGTETNPTNNQNKGSQTISINQGESYFPFVEAFRSLRTNIGFLGSDTPIHSLVISSAAHADGKSTVALHLAQAAAAMGQRVLLVDADMRRPTISKILNIPNEQGLSNVISSNLSLSEAIRQVAASDNLFVLTAGQIPPEPTKLLSSKKMQNIMQQLRQEFDLVIYDTPPLMGLADSSILATNSSGMVLVVRMDKTDRSILTQSLEQLKISRANILGMVVNATKKYNNAPYGYYYYYQPQKKYQT